MRAETGFADEIAQSGGATQPPRAMDQFSHGPRLPARVSRSKLWGEKAIQAFRQQLIDDEVGHRCSRIKRLCDCCSSPQSFGVRA